MTNPSNPPGTSQGLSSTDLPTLSQPTAPGVLPSDNITGRWVLGTVTAGGTGPCYGLRTDDGKDLAVAGATLGEWTVGDRIRLRIIAREDGQDCGPGEQVTGLELKPAI